MWVIEIRETPAHPWRPYDFLPRWAFIYEQSAHEEFVRQKLYSKADKREFRVEEYRPVS